MWGDTMAFPYLKDLLYGLTGFEVPLTQFIPTFGLCVALSFMVGIYLFSLELKRLQNAGIIQLPYSPSDFAQNLCISSMIFVMLGAKLFYVLEYPVEFIKDPFGMFFSRGGWTIFGGLLFGITFAIRFVKKRGQPAKVLCDAAAPILLIGYAIGRIGCHLSGDGDWGIPANLDLRPIWVPEWLWFSSYTNNIIGTHLEFPVYPTPLYEAIASVFLFLLLWSIRKHKFQAGWLFSVYLFLAGVERLLIEQIRVNVKYDFGWQFTQAELISMILIPVGLVGVVKFMGQKEFLPEIITPVEKVSRKKKEPKNKKNKHRNKA